MVECFQLTASMLHEVPWMAAPPSKVSDHEFYHIYHDSEIFTNSWSSIFSLPVSFFRSVYCTIHSSSFYSPWQYGRWKISQNFRRLMDNSERQVFNGPPETPKEHIFAAVRSLRDGDWRTCSKCIFALDRIWALVPNADAIKTDLLLEIKKSALRTYLFSYSTHYDSMSLDELINEFEMSSTLIHSIISKMMIAEELPASWDQPTNTIVLYKREPSKLQELALQYVADSGTVGPLSRFVSSNEQALNDRMGNNDQNNNQRGGRGNWNRRNTGHRRRW